MDVVYATASIQCESSPLTLHAGGRVECGVQRAADLEANP